MSAHREIYGMEYIYGMHVDEAEVRRKATHMIYKSANSTHDNLFTSVHISAHISR